MNDSWDERRKAQEEAFFKKQNEAAIERLSSRTVAGKPRLSPITGKPMVQMTLKGVVVDRCQDSGGIWLDAGELEQIVATAKRDEAGDNFLTHFLTDLFSKK